MAKKQKNETITYDGICPHCNMAVVGKLTPGNVCITTFCDVCDMFLLEDEVDWEGERIEELDFEKIKLEEAEPEVNEDWDVLTKLDVYR